MAVDVHRYINLAKKIKMKSDAGQINWTPASFVNTYEAPLGSDGMVAIQMLHDKTNPSAATYNLIFKNGMGQTFYNLREAENRSVTDLHGLLAVIYQSAEAMKIKCNGGSWLSGMESFVDAL